MADRVSRCCQSDGVGCSFLGQFNSGAYSNPVTNVSMNTTNFVSDNVTDALLNEIQALKNCVFGYKDVTKCCITSGVPRRVLILTSVSEDRAERFKFSEFSHCVQ